MTRKIQTFAYNYHAYIGLMLYHAHYSTVRPRRGCIQALPISNPLTSIYMLILLSPYLIICIECMYVYRYVMKFLINKHVQIGFGQPGKCVRHQIDRDTLFRYITCILHIVLLCFKPRFFKQYRPDNNFSSLINVGSGDRSGIHVYVHSTCFSRLYVHFHHYTTLEYYGNFI